MIIFTKYHGATNYKGSRISAHAPGWNLPRVYISYPHEFTGAECHAQAVREFMRKNKMPDLHYRIESIPGGYAFTPEAGFTLLIKKFEG